MESSSACPAIHSVDDLRLPSLQETDSELFLPILILSSDLEEKEKILDVPAVITDKFIHILWLSLN